eukprot:4930995-Pyramimonas_sp.AAC.1
MAACEARPAASGGSSVTRFGQPDRSGVEGGPDGPTNGNPGGAGVVTTAMAVVTMATCEAAKLL